MIAKFKVNLDNLLQSFEPPVFSKLGQMQIT